MSGYVKITDLMNYKKATIIYSQTNLNEELDLIIENYNYIPEIKNHRYTIRQIDFKKDDKDIDFPQDLIDYAIDILNIKNEADPLIAKKAL